MINMLVVNKNADERHLWVNQLIKDGYHVVPACPDLSAFVCALAKEKVDIAICSVNLIEKNAFAVLKATMEFFPRVKIIIVGVMSHETKAIILQNLTGVVIRNTFGVDIDKHWGFSIETGMGQINDIEQSLLLLLDEHFLSNEEAALLLKRVMPQWSPGYTVIGVVASSCYMQAYEAILETLDEMKQGFALRVRFNETCVIMDGSPDEALCFRMADALRHALLDKTRASFSIGISRERAQASELYACRKEAQRAASAAYLYGRDSVTHINYLCENDIEYIYPAHKEKRMIEQAMDGNRQEALRMLDEIFQVVKEREFLHRDLVNKVALSIVIKLNIAAISRAKALGKTQADAISFGKPFLAKSVEEAHLFLKDGIRDFADEMEAFNDLRKDALYIRLVKMKAEKPHLCVADLTKAFHTTVNFLNSAIARNSDGSIFDFLSDSEEEWL